MKTVRNVVFVAIVISVMLAVALSSNADLTQVPLQQKFGKDITVTVLGFDSIRFSGTISSSDTVIVAFYNSADKMISTKQITQSSSNVNIPNRADYVKVFGFDSDNLPLCEDIRFELPSAADSGLLDWDEDVGGWTP